jgi:hypothetical protein
MNSLENAVADILQKIPAGKIFDTHLVIEYLLQEYSDVYLSSFSHRAMPAYHGYIGQIVDSFAGKGVISTQIGKSWSINIRKQFSECTCWKKL